MAQVSIYKHNRLPREIWLEKREQVFSRDCGICQSPLQAPICRGKQGELTLKTCHIDHIKRLSAGGNNSLSNLRVLCAACHALRLDTGHRGMIAKALKQDLIPADWRGSVWE